MIIEKEIWKSIPNYEGLYEVSNFGRIKSLNSLGKNKIRLREASLCGRLYLSVMLSENSIDKRFTVHRLVAESFCPNPNSFKIVNHKNGDKLDNRAENLEWCTSAMNTQHAFSTGLMKGKKGGKAHNARLVLNIQTGVYYESVKEAAFIIGQREQSVSRKLLGVRTNNTPLIYV